MKRTLKQERMNSFNLEKALWIGVGVGFFYALTLLSVDTFAQEPKGQDQGQERVEGKEVTKEEGLGKTPMKGLIESSQAYKVRKNPDGSTTLSAPLHGGKGVQAEITIPKIEPSVDIVGPITLDENGNPMTWRQKRAREMAYRIAFEGLKAQGYDWKTYQEKKAKVRTQLDEWNAKNEATRKEIEANGPITTKAFIIPGTTPEFSEKLSGDDVGVRIENGHQVYYVNGERLDPQEEIERNRRAVLSRQSTKKDQTFDITTIETHASRSKRKGADEKDRTDSSTEAVKEPVKPSVQSTPPEKSITDVAPASQKETEQVRRRPIHEIAPLPEGTPSEDDIREMKESIEKAFPGFPGVSLNTRQILDRIFGWVVAPVFASGNSDISPENNAKNPCSPCSKEFEEYRARCSNNPFPEGCLDGIRQAQPSTYFKTVIDEISNEQKKIERLWKNVQENQEKNLENAKTIPLRDGNNQNPSHSDSFLESVEEGKLPFDPTSYAADIVNRTRSLTPEQFNDDAKLISGLFGSKDNPQNFFSMMETLLKEHPEIYKAIPDADQRLYRLQGKLYEHKAPNPLGEHTYIFVSYSLGDETIKDIIDRQGAREDVTLVMRGVPKGQSILDGIKRIQKLATASQHGVAVVLDPPLFNAFGITQVPSVVRTQETVAPLGIDDTADPRTVTKKRRDIEPMVAKVAGLHNDEWLMGQIRNGKRGDLGIQGTTYPIEEPDLIEVMKKRLATIDWEEKKAQAVKRFWKNQTFKAYPQATENRTREIDPSILVKKDMVDLAGNVIRKAGEVVNPLSIRPFTQTVIIFNPSSQEEIGFVKAFKEKFKAQGLTGLHLIATQMDKTDGWKAYETLTETLDSHVYVIVPEIEYTWHIERTPTVVTADNERKVFIVKEVAVSKTEKGEK